MKEIFNPKEAPPPIGPYSKAVKCGNLLFVSGQLPLDPKTDELTGSNIREQARKSLENMKMVLESAGSSLDKVIKTTVYLKDMDHFREMNDVYKAFFKRDFPARATVQVARLPKDALIEIECIAEVD